MALSSRIVMRERPAWRSLLVAVAASACASDPRPPALAAVDDVPEAPAAAPSDAGSSTSWVNAATDAGEATDAPPTDDDAAATTCLGGGAALSPWQMHRATGPVCFGRTFTEHGDPAEFALARVPAEADPEWTSVAAISIDFSQASALCGRTCTCLNGGEFTYFQTFLDVVDPSAVRSFVVSIGVVDDGARVSVFNAAHPDGVVSAGSYIRLGGVASTADLARQLAAGRNRVVITHIDDCCSGRSLRGVQLVVNHAPLRACP